ncbi:hybrid sensor histidine kinase/response regulator [Aquabacterium sp.]|uniref:hybrid sensor histidine kinase/response regulator n=1 Tax=Aquabacterium sp. TaxID=1872578 RepID=UPI002C590F83|nr:response regulator [Aquabacterium sp.]HSW04834.1 response regulator [Aquabacterium sp.]
MLQQAQHLQGWLALALALSLAALAVMALMWLRLHRSQRRQLAPVTELPHQDRIQRAILDSMGDGVLVIDPQGKVLFVNPAAERIVGIGFTPGDASGKSQDHGLYLPDQTTPYPTAELPLARAIRGEPCDDVEVFMANPAWPEGRWLSVTARPLSDETGFVSGGVAVISDITARKRAEAEVRRLNVDLEQRVQLRTTELEHNRNALQAIIENVPAAVYVKDLDGRYLRHNARLALVLGRGGESLVGLRDSDLIDAENAARVLAEDRQVAAQGQGLRAEHDMPGPDGEVRTFRTHVFPLQDSDGSTYAVGGISLDITDLKQAQHAAEAATRAKSEFLANMSHEIRTPMNAILGMSYLALQSGLTAHQYNYIQKVHASAESLLGVINDILDFSKIEAGKLDIEAIPFNLGEVMDQLSNLVGLRAQEKGLELLFVEPAQLPTALVGDPSRLTQVLLNLCNNAVKFTEQGEVTVAIEVLERDNASAQLSFEVRDTGIGIHAEQQHSMFQPFSQADASTSRCHGGTGLGLTISRHLVNLMGGEIAVDSAPGQGSRFSFSLRYGLQADAATQPPALQHTALRGTRVLVVDDNASAREVLAGMAGSLGLTADTARDGLDALRLVALADAGNAPYRLLLLDWQMPGMDGLACASLLSQRHRWRHPAPSVLMVTAFSRDEVVRRMAEQHLSVGALLTKPVTPATLFDACGAALGFAHFQPMRLARREAALVSHRARLGGARVLLVEDNAINRELAVDMLSGAGIVVSMARDGREALDMLDRQRFDAVLMDCQMPVMDGYTATRLLRQQARHQTLPVIAMTANAMVGDREKVFAAGMNDHIAKPINVEEMFTTLARWLRPAAGDAPESAAVGPPQARALVSATVRADAHASLPGIDVHAGLANMEGDETLYRHLLRMFRDQEADFQARFNAARAGGDAAGATRMAHDLKAVAGTLAAHELQHAAAALEDACLHDAEAVEIDKLARNAARQLDPVIAGLQSLGTGRAH